MVCSHLISQRFVVRIDVIVIPLVVEWRYLLLAVDLVQVAGWEIVQLPVGVILSLFSCCNEVEATSRSGQLIVLT